VAPLSGPLLATPVTILLEVVFAPSLLLAVVPPPHPAVNVVAAMSIAMLWKLMKKLFLNIFLYQKMR